MAQMLRKQIYITAAQEHRLRRLAARQRRSEAEIIREALDHHFGGELDEKTDLSSDPMWNIVGIAKSDGGDLSEQVDHYLYGAPRR